MNQLKWTIIKEMITTFGTYVWLQQRDFVLLIIYDMYAKMARALPIAQNYLTRKENVHVKH